MNVAVGCVAGLAFLLIGGTEDWPSPRWRQQCSCRRVVRVKTMWRQAPITAAVVIASALVHGSPAVGIVQGLHKVAEVVFGCLVGMGVSVAMSRVWLIRPTQ